MAERNFPEDNSVTVQHLKSIPALESFTEQDLSKLIKFSRIRTYPEGQCMFDENNPDDRVCYLISGKAKVMKDGRELMVLRRTGDVFGEIGVISGVAREASVYSVGTTTCLEIRLSHLDHLEEDSRLTFKYLLFRSFAELLAKRLEMTSRELQEVREELEQCRQNRK